MTMDSFVSTQEALEASLASITSPEQFGKLIEREQEWEQQMADSGQKRFREGILKNRQANQEAVSGPTRELFMQSLEPCIKAIEEFIAASEQRRGPKHIALGVFKEAGPEVIAYITAKVIIDNISSRKSPLKFAMKISAMIVDELRYRRFKAVMPALFDWKLRQFNTSSYMHMKRSLDASMHFREIDTSDLELTEQERAHVGLRALDIFIESTHYVAIQHTATAAQRIGTVVPTEATMEWIEKRCQRLEFMSPIFMPTLIPPRPWSNTRNGGYWFRLAGKFRLVRSPYSGQYATHHNNDLEGVDMPTVYTAINALQETSFNINKRVFEVMSTLSQRGSTAAGLPSLTKIEMPTKPIDIDTNEEARREWRKKAHAAHEREHDRACESIRVMKILATAQMLLQETDDETNEPLKFYFPYSLDFRGRAYAIPLYLQPQGDDLCRGLLTFGDGKALANLGAAAWLAIHGANCLAESPIDGTKLDKLPLQQRVDWVYEHNEQIKAVADDPYANDWWLHAEAPFQFLAFCFEWAGYLAEGTSFVSRLPIAMDGSCNGLQHYSALLRDEQCGRAVNLLPSAQPEDIYKAVAGQVIELLERDAKLQAFATADEKPLALDWLKWGQVNRKFVKRQVMTLPYGSKVYGFRDQIKDFVEGLEAEDRPAFMEDQDGFAHFGYMAGVIWEALQGTVVAACKAMEFFQKLARLCAKENQPIIWTAPNGLPVVQAYPESQLVRIKTMLAGSVYMPALEVPDFKDLNDRKQVSGISPNIIHSLDASAMMLTVEAAFLEEGITHFAMIHDSYATHAANTVKLAKLTREVFVRMYRDNDVLGNLQRDMLGAVDLSEVAPEDLPVLPDTGSLDLSEVLTSDYFFA